jgi:hypothetical protein
VNLGGLEGLGEGQVGENAGQPLRQHRLTGTGRADQDDVVTPGGSHFQRPLDVLLPFDIVEVRIVARMLTEQVFEIHMCGCESLGSIEKLNHLRQVLNPKNFDFADHGGLRCIGLGQDESFVFFFFCRHGDGQGATDGLD